LLSGTPALENADRFYTPNGHEHEHEVVLPSLNLGLIGLAITPNDRYLVAAEGAIELGNFMDKALLIECKAR
jgi:hypothetical protein